jgi:hypothetical protein
MKILLLAVLVSLVPDAYPKDFYYKVEEGDQIGTVLLSLGHSQLWSKQGKVNHFKKQSKRKVNRIFPGNTLKISEEDILFKKNVTFLENDYFRLIKKIKTASEYQDLLKEEESIVEQTPKEFPLEVVGNDQKNPEEESKEKSISSFNLYLGAGGFIASNHETNTGLSTKTFTGLQPLVQLKGIYSHSIVGSFSFDLLSKKIISSDYSFPINIDYRLQFLPKWNISESFKLALSHSVVRHSYVGKGLTKDVSYELRTNFLGIGFVWPQEEFWFEGYIEKAYYGETSSSLATIKDCEGIRLDTELVYPLYNNWKIIPGLNYYSVENDNQKYKLSVLETRVTFALELF